MKKLLFIILTFGPLLVIGQQPKMHLKIFGGINTSTLVYRIENVESDILGGIQLGGGFRVQYRALFGEVDFVYFIQGLTLSPREDDDLPIDDEVNMFLSGFEVPLVVGYIPIKTPVFGCYLYGGLVNWFNLKGWVEYKDETIKFKAKDANLHIYNLGARFGVQVDVAMFNFDFNYSIGITNSFKDPARINRHTLMFNIGFLF